MAPLPVAVATPEPELAPPSLTPPLEAPKIPAVRSQMLMPSVPAPQPVALTLFTPQPPPETAILQITRMGEASWCLPDQTDPPTELVFQAALQGQSTLWVFSHLGKVYPLAMAAIPPADSQAPIALMSLLPKGAQTEQWVSQVFSPLSLSDQDLLLLTRQGRLKRLAGTELAELGPRGLSLLKLKEDDHLQWVLSLAPGISSCQHLLLATSSGRLLRVPLTLEQIPRLGRTAQGQTAMRLRPQEALIGALVVDPRAQVGLLTQQGYGKALTVETVRLAKLEDLGTTVIQFRTPTDRLLALWSKPASQPPALRTSLGRNLSIQDEQLTVWGKDGPGDRLVSLDATEQILWVNSYAGHSSPCSPTS